VKYKDIGFLVVFLLVFFFSSFSLVFLLREVLAHLSQLVKLSEPTTEQFAASCECKAVRCCKTSCPAGGPRAAWDLL